MSSRALRWTRGSSLLGGGAWLLAASVASFSATPMDWPTYGHDPGGMRYSPLTQIDSSNVARLQTVWTYSMRVTSAAPGTDATPEAPPVSEGATPVLRRRNRLGGSEATPLVVDGLMYLSTPYRRVVALEPETGREVWHYDVAGPGQPSLRGVEYWPGDGVAGPRIVFGTRDGRLMALDAKTGQPAREFGSAGIVDMKASDIMPAQISDSPMAQYGLTSPPYSRDKVDVLARLDESRLDLANANVKRADGDFPIAWIKSYGKGRVFSSTLGHPDASWDDPRVQTLYLEGIKWVLRLTSAEPQPHPLSSAQRTSPGTPGSVAVPPR